MTRTWTPIASDIVEDFRNRGFHVQRIKTGHMGLPLSDYTWYALVTADEQEMVYSWGQP